MTSCLRIGSHYLKKALEWSRLDACYLCVERYRVKKALFKIVVGLLVFLVVGVAALAIVLPHFFDPNDYKSEITVQVKEYTGRELKFDGDIELSVFPWIGFELGQIALSNAPGFGKEPFVSFRSVDVKVKLLPLLRKQVEVSKVQISGLQLNLAKNAQGVSNWDDLVQSEANASARKTQPRKQKPTAEQGAGAAAGIAFLARKLVVSDARVRWQDRQSKTDITVDRINLQTGQIALGAPIPIELSFDIKAPPQPAMSVQLNADVSVDETFKSASVNKMALSIGPLDVHANIAVSGLDRNPRASGHVTIPNLKVREILKMLEVDYVPADSSAFSKFAIDTDFDATERGLGIAKLLVHLDDSKLQGSASVQNFDKPAVRFDLVLDHIDADRYMPKTSSTMAATPATASSSAAAVPLEPLRQLDVRGQLRVLQLKAMGIISTDIHIKANAKDGVIALGPNKAKLYGGRYLGQTNIDARGKTPKVHMRETLAAVQLGRLLKDAQLFDFFSGSGNVKLDLTSTGFDPDQALRTMSGDIALDIKEGVIEGVDLEKVENQLEKAWKGATTAGGLASLGALAKALPDIAPKKGDRTRFSQMRASAKLRNGVVNNPDLAIKTAALRITGSGQVNLPKQNVDRYQLVLGNFPILIKGSYAKGVPKIVPDTSAMWKRYQAQYKAQKKQEAKKKIETKTEEKKDELRDKLKEKLFNRFKR